MVPVARGVSIRAMIESDAERIRAWLADWLAEHIAGWCEAYGLNWTATDIHTHMDGHGLVEREWQELSTAAADPERFVRLVIAEGAPAGIIYLEQRMDRYLGVPIGVLSWIYVDPSHRHRGLALQLVAEGHKWFAERKVTVSEVFVTKGNDGAVAAYGRGGYRVLDHRMLAVIGRRDGKGPAS